LHAFEYHSVEPIYYWSNIKIPLLGIFGQEDSSPCSEQVDATEAELKKNATNLCT